MDIKTVKTSYIEFFSGSRENLQWISFHRLNSKDPLSDKPEKATAYRLFEIIDRIADDNTISRSSRKDCEINYLTSAS